MSIKQKTELEIECYYENGDFKTRNCNIGDYWGGYDDLCERVDIEHELKEATPPNGKYKIKIIIEKID